MLKYTFEIDGMMCGMCESHVNDAVRKTVETKKVTSSHSKGITEVICAGEIDQDAVTNALSALGYRVLSVKHEPYEKKGLFAFLRK